MPMKNHWARLGCDQVEAAGMMVMGWKPCQDWINWACCCCRCRRRRRGCRWLAVAVTVAVGLLEPPPLSSIICSFKPPCLMRISSSKVPQLILTFSLLSGSRWCLGLWPAWTEDQQVLKWRMAVSSQSWFGLIWDHKLQPRCFHWGGLNLPIRHLGQKNKLKHQVERLECLIISTPRARAHENHWPRSGKRKRFCRSTSGEAQRRPMDLQLKYCTDFRWVWSGMAGMGRVLVGCWSKFKAYSKLWGPSMLLSFSTF